MEDEERRSAEQLLGYYDGVGYPKITLSSGLETDFDYVHAHEHTHKVLDEASTTGALLRLCAMILRVAEDELRPKVAEQMHRLVASIQAHSTFVHEGLAIYLGLILPTSNAGAAERALLTMPQLYRQAAQACLDTFGSFDQVCGSPEHYIRISCAALDVGFAALNLDLLDVEINLMDLSPIMTRVAADPPDSRFARLLSQLGPSASPSPLGSFLTTPEIRALYLRPDFPVSANHPYREVTQRLFSLLNAIRPDVEFVSDRGALVRWSSENFRRAMAQLEAMGCERGKHIELSHVDDLDQAVTFQDPGIPEWLPLDRSLSQERYPTRSVEHFLRVCGNCAEYGQYAHLFLAPVGGKTLECATRMLALIRTQGVDGSRPGAPDSIDVWPFSVELGRSEISAALAQYPELQLTLRADERVVTDAETYFRPWDVPCFVLVWPTSVKHFVDIIESHSALTDVCVLYFSLDGQPAIVLKPKGARTHYVAPTTDGIFFRVLEEVADHPNVVPFDCAERQSEFGINIPLVTTMLNACYVGLDSIATPAVVASSDALRRAREQVRLDLQRGKPTGNGA